MSEESPKVMEVYVAGASLAFGVVVLVQEGVGAYYAWMNIGPEIIRGEHLFAIFVGVHLIGGFLGGYLVCRRSGEKTIRAGVVTALLAYIIESGYNIVFAGSFGGNLLSMLSLVLGSIIGAAYASRSPRP